MKNIYINTNLKRLEYVKLSDYLKSVCKFFGNVVK